MSVYECMSFLKISSLAQPLTIDCKSKAWTALSNTFVDRACCGLE